MKKVRLLSAIFLALILTACGVLGDDDNEGGADAPNRPLADVRWDDDPYTIVFRAEVVGGDDADALYHLNDVPYCTIYGDGQIVWTMETGTGYQVVFDLLNDSQIVLFADYLITQRQFYRYTAEADMEFSSTTPVVEQLTLNVNGVRHVTDAFGGWDYPYFEEILENCRRLGQSPTVFEPVSGWLSAEVVPADSSAPLHSWSASGAGIDLAVLAASGEKQWITGNLARAIWRWMYRSSPNLQFGQDGQTYQIALEVPGITHASPPPPASPS